MPKEFSRMEDSNRSANPSIHEISQPARRIFVQGGLAAAAAAVLAPLGLAGCAADPAAARQSWVPGRAPGRLLGFESVRMAAVDGVVVPPGYRAEVLYRWGDAVGIAGRMPAFRADGSNTAQEQALQAGMNHDGMHYFPLEGSQRGLLAVNHEYVDDALLHAGGKRDWSAEKVRKSMAAHGVSIVEVARGPGGAWQLVRPSRFARRITASTRMRLSGPAAGHALMRTAQDPHGETVLGTMSNCARGYTPWGTYLTCEENFADYFRAPEQPDSHQQRWGLQAGSPGTYGWHVHEARFDARQHPHEFNRFGWVVEIDPHDPRSVPVKRTALGRAAHEGATVAQTADGRVVVYMGEDARFEYIYKFVSRDAVRPGGYAANRDLLDHGTLFVARFDGDGRGEWLPLVQGQGPLTAERGFADQGEVLIKARQASDLLGATKMDRPEWTAVDPLSREVYCTLTNNSERGTPGHPGIDAANPRAENSMGQIIRWKEDGDLDARRFSWSHLVLAGDPQAARPAARGNVRGDAFGSPDGLWVDGRGVLWVMTDASSRVMGEGDYAGLPTNQMLAWDPTRGEMRRFLLGPRGCEVTGLTATPDLRTFFVNIQHPGDSSRSAAGASWPDGSGPPRSATVVITKDDGGVIGS